jgi:phosphatidate phosphatase APP1
MHKTKRKTKANLALCLTIKPQKEIYAVKVKLEKFQTWELDVGERSASGFIPSASRESVHSTHYERGCHRILKSKILPLPIICTAHTNISFTQSHKRNKVFFIKSGKLIENDSQEVEISICFIF